ncbi:hypothetical protein KUTeg_016430 [Tegillarca granosa]|uniref:Hemicentin-1 n=1 Tax=Tegillarca granosa TaxID=220873 RepID=A0ABQ9EL16_TEGGR|nr:hypothetical protein KUTeg_016430 [Tegillarca granosa]
MIKHFKISVVVKDHRNYLGINYGAKWPTNKPIYYIIGNIFVKGAWSLWTSWGDCSVTCENGTRTRTRDCNHPPANHGGTPCPGKNTEYKHCSLPMCPIDGVWATWSKWSDCSVSCANGTQFRTRNCTGPFYGGKNCDGANREVIECFPKICPVDGVWKDWSDWSKCTVTCGYGTQKRNRVCHGPFYNGADCIGNNTDIQSCNAFSCPVDGEWEPWSKWDECNVTCGGGGQSRYRVCEGPYFGGLECNGSAIESRDCNMHFCPIDGVWSDWSNWTECSLTCGNGTQNRSRSCDGPYYGGQNCSGDWDEVRDCNTHFCPVDGYWEAWSNWTTCNVSCGGGMQWRNRLCEEPKYGGANCTGDDLELTACNTHECPIDGVWVEWSDWTDCTLTCGNGTKMRNRTCNGPFFRGEECKGAANETEFCNSFYCPVDGIWEEWADWSECSQSCGRGHTWRNRTCTGPFYEGKPCEGESKESKYCNPSSCPVDGEWLTWQSWSPCDVSCGSGTRYRERNCDGPFDGGRECFGSSREATTCMPRKCPIDGEWDLWSTWSSCNATCGGGIMSRYRNCTLAQHGGKNCTGESDDFDECNTNHCPVDGVFLSWSTWGDCSVTCGHGERWRNRTCDGPYYNGENCTGDWEDRDNCHIRECPIDGIFQEWSAWGQCNTTCGGGIRERNRECSGPFFGGAGCNGEFSEIEDCNTHECPIDGMWEEWSTWEECNVTCAGGLQSRYRECIGTAFGGQNCTGPSFETRECNTHFCPVDGEWLPWTQWDPCNVTCGGGMQERTRFCVGPFYGGSPCEGDTYSYRGCNGHECPINGVWEGWSSWETCSVTCGGGEQSRNRTCFGPFYGGQNCSGDDEETQNCNTHPCPVKITFMFKLHKIFFRNLPICLTDKKFRKRKSYVAKQYYMPYLKYVDGIFTEWSNWFECNVTCGGGIQWRNRSCVGPFYGGANCSGDFETSRECNSHHCPVDGIWATWSDWGHCNVTCGGGIHWRYRECDGPYYGGANCSDDNADSKSCNEHPCPKK